MEHFYLDNSRVGSTFLSSESIVYQTWYNHGNPYQVNFLTLCELPLQTVRGVLEEDFQFLNKLLNATVANRSSNFSHFKMNIRWHVDYLSAEEFTVGSQDQEWYRGNLSCVLENHWNTEVFGELLVPLVGIDLKVALYNHLAHSRHGNYRSLFQHLYGHVENINEVDQITSEYLV